MLFLHSWEHLHVSLNSCDCFQMCAVSFSLSFPIFYFISNRLLNHLKLSSSIRSSSSLHPVSPACLVQGFEGPFCGKFACLPPQIPLSVSPPAGVRWALRAPQTQRQPRRFSPALPSCPCVPPRPHSRHTHGFDNKERLKDMVKESTEGHSCQ